ncbi:DUF4142 domain-containing protein [Chitinophaga polysaccharea]|uniref:DUF4142 domain-containing protein n=1 Tax=Chitinophaga TaxID=79328 RepID=UPI0014556F1B|nr:MULTISPECIES: DUF4142 domain-containing protein [Chitinophaga]NLR57949.1 DUF4142 domain-containing protein [Chitinophaga polysaccharea]NLU93542.1 DUF4142 domain-containing protein [Chitinophaga sp. Ak27]
MKKLMLVSTIALTAWMMQSCGNNTNRNPQSEKPADSAKDLNEIAKPVDENSSKFAVDAANGGMMEVAMGKLAQEKASNARVKAFGAMMVTDHSKAGDQLKELAGKKNIALPAELSTQEKNHLDDLSKKSGKDFDKSYIDMMVDDHDKDVKEFEKASSDLTDPDLKTWATNTLPTLKVHQDSARAIQKAFK